MGFLQIPVGVPKSGTHAFGAFHAVFVLITDIQFLFFWVLGAILVTTAWSESGPALLF